MEQVKIDSSLVRIWVNWFDNLKDKLENGDTRIVFKNPVNFLGLQVYSAFLNDTSDKSTIVINGLKKIDTSNLPLTMPLVRIDNGGHSWLQVPIQLLKQLGIKGKFSAKSIRNKLYAYFEEDYEMHELMEYFKLVNLLCNIKLVYRENFDLDTGKSGTCTI